MRFYGSVINNAFHSAPSSRLFALPPPHTPGEKLEKLAEEQILPLLFCFKASPTSSQGLLRCWEHILCLAVQEERVFEETKANFLLLASVSCKQKGELASVHRLCLEASLSPSLVLVWPLDLGCKFQTAAAPEYHPSSKTEMKSRKSTTHLLGPWFLESKELPKLINLSNHQKLTNHIPCPLPLHSVYAFVSKRKCKTKHNLGTVQSLLMS